MLFINPKCNTILQICKQYINYFLKCFNLPLKYGFNFLLLSWLNVSKYSSHKSSVVYVFNNSHHSSIGITNPCLLIIISFISAILHFVPLIWETNYTQIPPCICTMPMFLIIFSCGCICYPLFFISTSGILF